MAVADSAIIFKPGEFGSVSNAPRALPAPRADAPLFSKVDSDIPFLPPVVFRLQDKHNLFQIQYLKGFFLFHSHPRPILSFPNANGPFKMAANGPFTTGCQPLVKDGDFT